MKRAVCAIVVACGAFLTLTVVPSGQPGMPVFTRTQADAGRQIYGTKCVNCHGSELQGAGGPALSGASFRQRWFGGQRPMTEMYDTITQGMPPDAAGSITELQALDLIAFVLQANAFTPGSAGLNRQMLLTSIATANDDHGAVPTAAPARSSRPRPASFPVSATDAKPARTTSPDDAELLASRAQDWLFVNQDVRGQRFSKLAQITPQNVRQLTPACILQLGDLGSFQTRPLVYKGRLYLTTTHKTLAVDATRCTRIWEHTYVPREAEPLPANRGAALYKGKVFRGTTDGHLLALDAETGELLWDAWVADSEKQYFVAGAPVAFAGKVFVGEGGGDFPLSAHIHAFDADSGRHLWSFETIKKDDPASWPPGTEVGGGGSWTGGTLDPQASVVYFPVGNPYPSYVGGGRTRPGDNLYTNAIVGLDLNTGKLAGYAQQTKHDRHDWDTGSAPTVYDLDGKRFVAVASKNGYLHIYDRSTHADIAKVPTGRIENNTAVIPVEGIHVCPGHYGGVAQNGQAFDPTLKMLFLSSMDWCDMFYDAKRPVQDARSTAHGWVRAYDAATGREAWATRTDTPMIASVTPTAGGVLFTGDLAGYLLGFDSKTGKELYRFNTGGPISGGVSSYEVGGKQYLAVPSGNLSRGNPWHPATAGASPTLVIFALP